MSFRKLSLLTTTVSLIALGSLTGCAGSNGLFSSSSDESEGSANYKAAMQVADVAVKEGDFNTAASFYMRASQFEPQDVRPLISLADVLWQLKNAEQSAKVLEHARSLSPENETVLRNLGRSYVALGQSKEAQQAYLAALAINPNDARILNGLGISYALDNDFETAESHYRAGLTIDPQNLDIQNNLAYTLISAKRYEEAITILKPLATREGSTERQRQNLALAYGLAGHETEARKMSLIDLSPAEVDRNLAVYRQLRGEPEQAKGLMAAGSPKFERGNLSAAADTAPAPRAAMAPAPVEVTEQVPPTVYGTPIDNGVAQAAIVPPTAAPAEVVAPPAEVAAPPVEVKAPVVEEKAPVAEVKAPVVEEKPIPAQMTAPTPEPVRQQPVDLIAATKPAPAAAEITAPAVKQAAAPSRIVAVGNKIYLGSFASESDARTAWIKVWTSNSSILSSLVASIEPRDSKMALFAVGADDGVKANEICTKLRQSGVSCGTGN